MSIEDYINRRYDLKKQCAVIANEIASISEHLEDEGPDMRRAVDKRRYLREELIAAQQELLDCERSLDLESTK